MERSSTKNSPLRDILLLKIRLHCHFCLYSIPNEAWMSVEEVVDLSLNAVKDKEVIFIPGEMNQKFVELVTNPKLGKRTRENWIKRAKIPRN